MNCGFKILDPEEPTRRDTKKNKGRKVDYWIIYTKEISIQTRLTLLREHKVSDHYQLKL